MYIQHKTLDPIINHPKHPKENRPNAQGECHIVCFYQEQHPLSQMDKSERIKKGSLNKVLRITPFHDYTILETSEQRQ